MALIRTSCHLIFGSMCFHYQRKRSVERLHRLVKKNKTVVSLATFVACQVLGKAGQLFIFKVGWFTPWVAEN